MHHLSWPLIYKFEHIWTFFSTPATRRIFDLVYFFSGLVTKNSSPPSPACWSCSLWQWLLWDGPVHKLGRGTSPGGHFEAWCFDIWVEVSHLKRAWWSHWTHMFGIEPPEFLGMFKVSALQTSQTQTFSESFFFHYQVTPFRIGDGAAGSSGESWPRLAISWHSFRHMKFPGLGAWLQVLGGLKQMLIFTQPVGMMFSLVTNIWWKRREISSGRFIGFRWMGWFILWEGFQVCLLGEAAPQAPSWGEDPRRVKNGVWNLEPWLGMSWEAETWNWKSHSCRFFSYKWQDG